VIKLHAISVRVYFEDTDAGGIVYYANYLKFFERARSDWLRTLGVNHRDLADQGLGLVVRDCAVQYLKPARLDDLIVIEVGVNEPAKDVRRASIRFAQRALTPDGRTELATGSIRIACVDLRSGRPAGLPDGLMDRISTAALSAAPNPTTERTAEPQ